MRSYQESYDLAVTDKRLKVITPTYVEFKKKGDQIIGKFIGSTAVKSSMDESEYNQYIEIGRAHV